MSFSSAYSSPSNSSNGLQAHSCLKSSQKTTSVTSHNPNHNPNPNSKQPNLSSHSSKEFPVRRRVGIPYSSTTTTQPPTRTPSNLIPSTSPSKPSRSLITVLPPDSLASSPSQRRPSASSSAYGPSSHFRKGTLIPLYPTLAAQLAAISREYGFPSTGGMVLYLIEGSARTGELGNQLVDGPRISEEAWQILWSGVFEDEQQEAFQNEYQTKELYNDEELDHFPDLNNSRYFMGAGQDSAEEEEVLHGGLEELINSGLDFPNPPPNCRPAHPTRVSQSSQEDLNSNATTLFTEPSPISSCSSGRSEDLVKLHTTRDTSVVANNSHARSFSSLSNQLSSIPPARLHSTDLPSRPSTSLSTRLPRRRSLKAIGGSSRFNHRPPSSENGSFYSTTSRPRRIGAGTIVGKIEFDIDRSRTSARWYDLWLNPPSINRNNPSSYPSSEDHARPLLLPNLVTQRKISSTSLQDRSKQPPVSSNLNESPRLTNSNGSTPSQDKFHSFLAFDDNNQLPDTRSGRISPNPGHIFYSNQDVCSGEELSSRGSSASQPSHVDKLINPSTTDVGMKRQFGCRIVDEQHHQAMAMISAQASHQALVDQIDSQLFSPIELDFPQNHSYGLSLRVDSHLELADIRYTQNQDDVGCTFFSSPANEPMTMSSLTDSLSHIELPFTDSLLVPDAALSKRNSSMDIKSNLDELEQALASLSPKALNHHPLPPLNAISTDAIESRTSSLAWGKRTSDTFPRKPSKQKSDSHDERNGGKGFKLFESLQGSFHDLKHRSSQQEIAVGLTEGYTREDVREYKAPLSPVITKRSFSPSLRNMMRPTTTAPSNKKPVDRLVTKAAGIMSGKFRNSVTK